MSATGPSRTNIKEANEHLKQLHQRVFELDNQLQLQAIHLEELQRTNAELQHKSQEARRERERETEAKDSQIAELTRRLQQTEEYVQTLLETAQERDAMLVKLEKKARLFYEVVEHKSVLAKMVKIMEELSQEQDDLGAKKKQSSPGAGDGGSRITENGDGGEVDRTTQGSTGSNPDTANR